MRGEFSGILQITLGHLLNNYILAEETLEGVDIFFFALLYIIYVFHYYAGGITNII